MNKYGFRIATVGSSLGSMIGGLIFLLAVAVTQAATVWALSEVYLGRNATISDSLRATIKLWYRYLGIAIWQVWSAMWLALLLAIPAIVFFVPQFGLTSLAWLGGIFVALAIIGGLVYGVIAYIRNSLAVPAAVVEQSKVRASMRRSKTLTTNTKGRIFVVLLITVALSYVAAAIQMPLIFVIARTPLQPHVVAQAVILIISFLTHTLVSPVALIGLTLVYFDQRVRLEAFDLVMLLGGEMIAPAAVPLVSEPPLLEPVQPFESVGPTDGPIGNDGQS